MQKKVSVGLVLLFAGLCLLYAANTPTVDARAASPIDPALAVVLSDQAPDQPVSVIVILKDQVDVKAIGGRDRAERQRNIILALRQKADSTQADLKAWLEQRRNQGEVRSFMSLWILNAIAVTANSAIIDELAQLPQVGSIVPDRIILAPSGTVQSNAMAGAPEPNLSVINASAMWDLGFRGQGIVVASMDTGVDYTHPDLTAQWRGGSNSWYDPYGQHPTVPTDVNGHGTWTMGVMVGRDNGGTSIGVAPQATWIAVKIFNDSGTATSTAIHQGFQWLLDCGWQSEHRRRALRDQ